MIRAYHTITPQDPPAPDKNLPTINTACDFPTGQIEFQKIKNTTHTIQTGFRPKTSLMGAMTKGPKAWPSTKMENASCALEADKLRSVAI